MSSFLYYVNILFLMVPRHPISTRTETLLPYTTLVRSPTTAERRASVADSNIPNISPSSATSRRAPRRPDRFSDSFVAPALLTKPKRRLESELRSEEHTSALQSLMRNSNAVICLKKQISITTHHNYTQQRTQYKQS